MIMWTNRYSDTMENDDKGRWARVAYAGKFGDDIVERNPETGLDAPTYFEIAWVKKVNVYGEELFTITYSFPSSKLSGLYKTLEEAIKDVEVNFRWFINCVK